FRLYCQGHCHERAPLELLAAATAASSSSCWSRFGRGHGRSRWRRLNPTLPRENLDVLGTADPAVDYALELSFGQLHLLANQVRKIALDRAGAKRTTRRQDQSAAVVEPRV